jgi:hypothetical protein
MVKRAAGLVSILLGVATLAWFAFHLDEAASALGNPIVLVLPVAMIFLGWRWLTKTWPGRAED